MHYRAWSKGHCDDFKLGEVQFVTVEYDIVVANMIGQSGIGWSAGRPPIRYGALAGCMERAAIYAKKNGMSIHAPRFGAVLAGGNWTDIEWLINKIILPYDVDVTIYDLPVAEDNSNLIKQRQDMNLF